MPFIVQDRETALFLMPSDDGDVGFTQWAHEAGRFIHVGEANDTAVMNCFEGFYIIEVS